MPVLLLLFESSFWEGFSGASGWIGSDRPATSGMRRQGKSTAAVVLRVRPLVTPLAVTDPPPCVTQRDCLTERCGQDGPELVPPELARVLLDAGRSGGIASGYWLW